MIPHHIKEQMNFRKSFHKSNKKLSDKFEKKFSNLLKEQEKTQEMVKNSEIRILKKLEVKIQEITSKEQMILQELEGTFLLAKQIDRLETTVKNFLLETVEVTKKFARPCDHDSLPKNSSPTPPPSSCQPTSPQRTKEQESSKTKKSDIKWPHCTKCECRLDLTWPKDCNMPLECAWCGVAKGSKSYAKFYSCGCEHLNMDSYYCLKCAKSCDGYVKDY